MTRDCIVIIKISGPSLLLVVVHELLHLVQDFGGLIYPGDIIVLAQVYSSVNSESEGELKEGDLIMQSLTMCTPLTKNFNIVPEMFPLLSEGTTSLERYLKDGDKNWIKNCGYW